MGPTVIHGPPEDRGSKRETPPGLPASPPDLTDAPPSDLLAPSGKHPEGAAGVSFGSQSQTLADLDETTESVVKAGSRNLFPEHAISISLYLIWGTLQSGDYQYYELAPTPSQLDAGVSLDQFHANIAAVMADAAEQFAAACGQETHVFRDLAASIAKTLEEKSSEPRYLVYGNDLQNHVNPCTNAKT